MLEAVVEVDKIEPCLEDKFGIPEELLCPLEEGTIPPINLDLRLAGGFGEESLSDSGGDWLVGVVFGVVLGVFRGVVRGGGLWLVILEFTAR